MGRYKAERIIVKECPELTVVFWDNSSIYVYPKGYNYGLVFHKYHAPLGTYTKSWKPFKRRLLKIKYLRLSKVFELADYYEILYKGSVGRLDFNKKPVEIRYHHWSVKGVARAVQIRTREPTAAKADKR